MIDTDVQYYYVVWCLALLGILAARNMIHSRVGRALRSIESSEIASASIGIDTQKYKLQVFVMSAVLPRLPEAYMPIIFRLLTRCSFIPTHLFNF